MLNQPRPKMGLVKSANWSYISGNRDPYFMNADMKTRLPLPRPAYAPSASDPQRSIS